MHSNGSRHEDRGPMMIRVMLDEFDPTIKSGVNNLKSNISEFNLTCLKQYVPEILDKMLVTFNKIILEGGQDDTFMLKIFNAF